MKKLFVLLSLNFLSSFVKPLQVFWSSRLRTPIASMASRFYSLRLLHCHKVLALRIVSSSVLNTLVRQNLSPFVLYFPCGGVVAKQIIIRTEDNDEASQSCVDQAKNSQRRTGDLPMVR